MECPDPETLAGYVGRGLGGDRTDELRLHMDGCPSCREVVVALARASAGLTGSTGGTEIGVPGPEPRPGERIGRFVVGEPIGAGAMGIVYSARDPELGREVAIKVLRYELSASSVARARLLREAKAMAMLSHPNVATVHEVGNWGDQMFIAMERVDGTSLADWLAAERRGWREIVRAMAQAGRGLAAAHDAGIAHRDFKPANVVVGADGRVRVLDFGLALVLAERTPDVATGSPAGAGELSTRASSLVGTPAYMAPEQLDGEAADARSDQYSFCFTLAEAVSGARLPGRLRRLLRRGMHADPGQRFPSMAALLAELDRVERGRRSLAIAAAAVGLPAIAVGVWLAVGGARPDPCGDGAARMARVWNDARRRALGDAFARTGVAQAAAVAEATIRYLDGRSLAWTAMHRDSCEATERGEQPTEVRAARDRCLDRRLGELAAAIELLVEADASTVARGTPTLPVLDECASGVHLLGETQPAGGLSPERRRAIEEQITRITALTALGKFEQAQRVLEPILGELERAGDTSLLASALSHQGELAYWRGDHEGSKRLLREAIKASDRGGRDSLRVHAQMVLAHGYMMDADFAAAHEVLSEARAVVSRMGDPPYLVSRVLELESVALGHQGKHEEALKVIRQAFALTEGREAERWTISIRGNLASSLIAAGRPKEAIPLLEQAIADGQRLYGKEHKDIINGTQILGNAYEQLGDMPRALETYRRALDMARRLQGPEHIDTSETETLVAGVLVKTGKPGEALPLLRHALAVRERVFGADSPSLVWELTSLADALTATGVSDEARSLAARVAALCKGGQCDPEIVKWSDAAASAAAAK